MNNVNNVKKLNMEPSPSNFIFIHFSLVWKGKLCLTVFAWDDLELANKINL